MIMKVPVENYHMFICDDELLSLIHIKYNQMKQIDKFRRRALFGEAVYDVAVSTVCTAAKLTTSLRGAALILL